MPSHQFSKGLVTLDPREGYQHLDPRATGSPFTPRDSCSLDRQTAMEKLAGPQWSSLDRAVFDASEDIRAQALNRLSDAMRQEMMNATGLYRPRIGDSDIDKLACWVEQDRRARSHIKLTDPDIATNPVLLLL